MGHGAGTPLVFQPEAMLCSMSQGAKSVLDAFQQLPPGERDEVVRELLRRAARETHEAPSDADLLQAADEVFLELDSRKNQG